MQFTMKNLMETDIMKLAQVKSGSKSLNNRYVESISVIEMPVENFVRKNEFVLTTAIGCGEDPATFLKFVQDILNSEAAALAIATGRHVIAIPAVVLDFAEKHDFPIIEIPWEVRFADVTQSVLGELHKWHRKVLDRSEELQRRLLHLFLEGAELSEAAEIIRLEMGLPALILDREGTVKGKSQESQQLFAQWNQFFLTYDTHHFEKEFIIGSEEGDKFQVVSGTLLCIKIIAMETIQGYLLLELPQILTVSSLLANGNDHMIDYAVTATALWFQREKDVHETEFRLKDDFVWSLAKEEAESWDTLYSRAKSLDYNISLPYVCILGAPEQLEMLYKKNKHPQKSYEHWKQKTIRLIEEQIIETGNSIQLNTMTTFQREWFVIFLEVPVNDISLSIKNYLDLLEKNLQHIFPDLIISWGIGENDAGIRTFHESFNKARIALEVGRKQKGPGNRSTYTNTSLYRTLLSLSKNTEIQEITLSAIGPLIDYDNQRGLDLVNTLIIYIRNQGNASQTSRALNLHRQSLLYRLRKIESLTGRSLVDPDDLFLLDLSIKLWTSGIMDERS